MASKAVNVPTDVRIKEKDVNAKLQLYGIFAAFAEGKAPSNKQIDVALNTVLQWQYLQKPSKKLSTDGQQLVADVRDIIEKAKVLLLTKNQGNLIQDFIWQTQNIATGNAPGVTSPVGKETADQHAQEALHGLRTLGELLITNGQFRKLLSDATILLRDIAGDGATRIADKINPSEDELAQIDHAAEDDVWHDKPDLSTDNLRNQIRSRMPASKQDAQDAVGNATQAAHPDGSRDPADAADRAAGQGADSGLDFKAGAVAGKESAKNKASANVDDDQKDAARTYKEKTKNYFKQKMPKGRREQIVYRLKKMVVEIQGHRDYQEAIDTLLNLAEEYAEHTKTVATQGQGAVQNTREQTTIKAVESDLKTILERFANSTSFDDLLESINQIYRDADEDPELKRFFKDADRFLRRCLQEQGYILEDGVDDEWNRLYDHGHFLLRDRYRNHTDRVADEFKFLADQYDADPQNTAFAASLKKLFTDLGTDDDGQMTFKPHLIKDLTEVLLPGFFEQVRYVPIPRIEYSDPMVDAIVENLVIEGDNLAPNIFELGSDNFWHWGRKGNASHRKNKVTVSVSGVQMDLRDVAFYVKKKEGFPSITDKGVMDLFLGGSGLSFKIAMENADKKDAHHFFKINSVNVDLKNLDIKLKQSNHKLLFTVFKPLLLRVVRPALLKAIEQQIRDSVHKLDAFLYDVKKEADRATEEAKNNPDPEVVANILQHYLNAIQHEFTKAQRAKKEHIDPKTVKMAVTQHDSIFKNIALPNGISTKATEYKELAAKGEAWESPVFSIGTAKESTLPRVSEPTRKHHKVTPATLRSHPTSNTNTNADSNVFSNSDTTSNTYTTTHTTTNTNHTQLFDGTSSTHTALGRENPVWQGVV